MNFRDKLIHAGNDGNNKTSGQEPSSTENPSAPAVTLLVLQSDNNEDYHWSDIFAGHSLDDGRQVHVVQTGWDCLLVQADSPAMSPNAPSAIVHVRQDGGSQTIRPDFVLVRNEVRSVTPTHDWRNALFGLMYANVPAVNSLSSIYCFLERPIVQAELHKIQCRLGHEKFPVIPQTYFSSHATMMYGSRFPAVLKVGPAHAGLGKMCVDNHHDWEDVRSVVAMTEGKYCTGEPFVNGAFDVRIQKIGDTHYRAYSRTTMSGNWKTNTGCAVVEDIPVTDQYKLWADEASKLFGGLDICTVDVIHESSGQEYILEVNGTSSGLSPEHAAEDNAYIREVVLEKMNRLPVK